jgi:preprotein translocase YajC subunit
MPEDGNILFWVMIIGGMVLFLFLPQFMARRRQQKREANLQIGDSILTIGGFIGELLYIDTEANIARIRLADGVEVRILPSAISGKRTSPSTGMDEPTRSDY